MTEQPTVTTGPGGHHMAASLFQPFAIRDGRLVTGQQQCSARAVVRLVIEMLGV